MYYKLTREDYKIHEAEFKKTYVGKTWFMKWLVSYIVFLVFIFEIVFNMVLDYIDGVRPMLETIDFFYVVALIIVGIASILYQIEYRRELKDYIITKGKK